LSLSIYLDDCAFSYRLRTVLIEAGHQVQIPAEVEPPLTGAADPSHFAHACATKRVILTKNPGDFFQLHQQHAEHPGILAVYQDNDPTKDMSYDDIMRAIANLEGTAVTVAGEFWVLNAYRW
jgi:predicted nuclease of predicted toxin-antitoxin system